MDHPALAVSRDKTRIAYERTGNGPALVLVAGALAHRRHPMSLEHAAALSQRFTVFNYDRRGRGASDDTAPYSPEREVDDLEAVIDAAGGRAIVYGISSGAILALNAAVRLGGISQLVVWEPPLIVSASRPALPPDYVTRMQAFARAGLRSEAVELFLTASLRFPESMVAELRASPHWAEMLSVGLALAYDAELSAPVMAGRPLSAEPWSRIGAPTLVLHGDQSPPFMAEGAQALVKVVPGSRLRMLPGQPHAVQGSAIAPVLFEELLSS
jgi:pimeloyl-ACP methyl ester carboxylesterase